MKRFPIEIGSVVTSLAGRDEGRSFIVAKLIDEDFVEVADGGLRGMDRLKKKRRKHLKPSGRIVEEFVERSRKGALIENHEVRKWLKMEEE